MRRGPDDRFETQRDIERGERIARIFAKRFKGELTRRVDDKINYALSRDGVVVMYLEVKSRTYASTASFGSKGWYLAQDKRDAARALTKETGLPVYLAQEWRGDGAMGYVLISGKAAEDFTIARGGRDDRPYYQKSIEPCAHIPTEAFNMFTAAEKEELP